MIGLKVGGIIVAAFIAGAFVASPELRAYAANTVGSIDIIDGSIQSVDIGSGFGWAILSPLRTNHATIQCLFR